MACCELASCPSGPATVHGVGLLTEMYAIYIETSTSHRAIAQCFGLGLFQTWHFASHTGTLPTVFNCSTGCPLSSYNISKCQIELECCQKYPTWPSMVTIDPISNLCDRNWPRKCTFSWIIGLDLWPWVILTICAQSTFKLFELIECIFLTTLMRMNEVFLTFW